MTRAERSELRSTLDRVASDVSLALDLAWKAAKGKTEHEALTEIGELISSARRTLLDAEALIEEVIRG